MVIIILYYCSNNHDNNDSNHNNNNNNNDNNNNNNNYNEYNNSDNYKENFNDSVVEIILFGNCIISFILLYASFSEFQYEPSSLKDRIPITVLIITE